MVQPTVFAESVLQQTVSLTNIAYTDRRIVKAIKVVAGPVFKVSVAALALFEVLARLFVASFQLIFTKKTISDLSRQVFSTAQVIFHALRAIGTLSSSAPVEAPKEESKQFFTPVAKCAMIATSLLIGGLVLHALLRAFETKNGEVVDLFARHSVGESGSSNKARLFNLAVSGGGWLFGISALLYARGQRVQAKNSEGCPLDLIQSTVETESKQERIALYNSIMKLTKQFQRNNFDEYRQLDRENGGISFSAFISFYADKVCLDVLSEDDLGWLQGEEIFQTLRDIFAQSTSDERKDIGGVVARFYTDCVEPRQKEKSLLHRGCSSSNLFSRRCRAQREPGTSRYLLGLRPPAL